MTTLEFAKLTMSLRDAQRKYFRTRSPADLLACKDIEREFDRTLDRIFKGPSLFDAERTEDHRLARD